MQETYEELQKNGKLKAEIERKLLMLMFNGFSSFKVLNKDTSEILALREICKLSDYTKIAIKYNDSGYRKLSEEAKRCFDAQLALDALENRGLLEIKAFFTDEFSPEDGPIHLEQSFLRETDAWTLSWFSNALITDKTKERTLYIDDTESSPPRELSFDYLAYSLTSKGYDVALKFQEHEDAEKRYEQQKGITEKSASAASSSSKTAKRALWAATFIAVGSIGNLALNIYTQYCCL